MTSTRILTLAFVLGVAACDPYWRVVVTAPLTRPLADSCATEVYTSLTSIPPFHMAVGEAAGAGDTVALIAYLGSLSPLTQSRRKNGSAVLEASVGRFLYGFDERERDRIGSALGPVLLRVRDECGGIGLADAQYRVRRSPF